MAIPTNTYILVAPTHANSNSVVCLFIRFAAEGLAAYQKQKRGAQKLKMATRSLKRKLEQSFGVDIPTPGASPIKRQRKEKDEDLERCVALFSPQSSQSYWYS